MRKLPVILLAVSFLYCSRTEDIPSFYYLGVGYEFSVISPQGKDLLDPLTTNHFDSTGIKLYYDVDGEIIEPYEPHLDYPRHFRIYKHEDKYRIQLTLNDSGTPEKSITYIQWNEMDTDTIVVQFERTNMSILKRQVWLNEQLIWEWTSNEEAYSEIVKDNLPI